MEEYGVVVDTGLNTLLNAIPEIIEDASNELSGKKKQRRRRCSIITVLSESAIKQ